MAELCTATSWRRFTVRRNKRWCRASSLPTRGPLSAVNFLTRARHSSCTALLPPFLPCSHHIDELYITFRYVRNLAQGLCLVYNPGEWLLGTTAPLWAFVLSGSYKLASTYLPWLSTAVSALCDAASVALL